MRRSPAAKNSSAMASKSARLARLTTRTLRCDARCNAWFRTHPDVTRRTRRRDLRWGFFPSSGLLSAAVKSVREIVGLVAKWTRDWRVRVLVPVVLINLGVFVGLYTLMYRYAMGNLVNTHKFGAMLLLDDLELDLHDLAFAHNRAQLQKRLDEHASGRKLLAVTVYDSAGVPVASTRGAPSEREIAQAQVILTRPGHPAMWLTEGEHANIFGVRALRNADQCAVCHERASALGAIQIGIDMAGPLAEAKTRVRRNFAMAGGTWLGLLALMFWTGGFVIGRPLAAIEKTMSAAGATPAGTKRHDLESLASRMHETLWGLIRTQRQRDEQIAKHMARAEQLASLGQLAAGLTHEIKNPLAGVSAAVELLRDEGDGAYREVHEQILGELRRVNTTVDGLLRLGKPQPPQRTDVDLARLTREVTSLFSARLRRQGVTLETTIADDLPTLQLDSGLLVQLLINLLTNSMQATDRGGTINVLVAPFPRMDGVLISVADSGRGIAREHLDRIFDPFFTTKEEGTGLGLPICKQIVEQHGGTMQIESEPGEGTRVLLLFPDANAMHERLTNGAAATG
jgi:signal transduction histidine kinase